jgi:hypothetical protein
MHFVSRSIDSRDAANGHTDRHYTSHQLDTLIEGGKTILQIGVIVLIDNIVRDKQLNIACSLESPITITLSQVLFKLYNKQSIYTIMSYHKSHISAQTTACTVSFVIEDIKAQTFLLQSKINDSHYHPNTYCNILPP